jgi:ribosome maturation factor RimP
VSGYLDAEIREAIEPVLSGMGFSMVELSVGRLKGSTRISVVLYRRQGVGIDECAEASRLLLPRLETLEGLEDVSLEVSSPGIERQIRSPAEYEIFKGRGVRVLAGDETEWIGGIIDGVEDGTLWLKRGRERKGFAVSSIRKARLDHPVEIEEAENAV